MKNLPLLIGTIVGTLVLIIAIALFSSGSPETIGEQSSVDNATLLSGARHIWKGAPATAEGSEVESSQDELAEEQGSENEKNEQELVTVVEFSDFQCPACKAAVPIVESLKATYSEDIQFVYRHFPLDSIHPNARLAATASEAVSQLDAEKFWQYHDVLFANQDTWANIRSRDELKETFANYAEQLDLDRTQFLEKMEDASIAELVNSDVTLGTQLGVNATPTFYVNGTKTSAPQLHATVESVLNN